MVHFLQEEALLVEAAQLLKNKAAVECYKFFRPLLRPYTKRLFDFERNVLLNNIALKTRLLKTLLLRIRRRLDVRAR